MKKIIIILAGLVLVIFFGWILFSGQKEKISPKLSDGKKPKSTISPTKPESEIVFPIAEFKKRITKKPFGIFITPETSPVQPERFSGYHTGVDVEYEDVSGEVPIFSICNGEIVLAKWVAGYGGTIGLKCNLEKQVVYALYGHLEPKSLTKKTQVKKGEKIAILGEGQTQTTDFERKHLHFALSKEKLDLRGYVEIKNELDAWHDPQEFF